MIGLRPHYIETGCGTVQTGRKNAKISHLPSARTQVDAHNIVPLWEASEKKEYTGGVAHKICSGVLQCLGNLGSPWETYSKPICFMNEEVSFIELKLHYWIFVMKLEGWIPRLFQGTGSLKFLDMTPFWRFRFRCEVLFARLPVFLKRPKRRYVVKKRPRCGVS